MLALRHLVTRSGGLYSADPADLPLLACYANSIASRRVCAGKEGHSLHKGLIVPSPLISHEEAAVTSENVAHRKHSGFDGLGLRRRIRPP